MVSGKPPRRSKSSNEPVTIDLQAEETASDASSPASATENPEEHAADVEAEARAPEEAETATRTETEAGPVTDTVETDNTKSESIPPRHHVSRKGHPRWQPLRLPALLVASSPSPLPAACNMPAIYPPYLPRRGLPPPTR